MINKEIRKENGITLTALIITVIVLLILASASISILIGPDGLIGQAQTAAINTKKAEIKEKVELKIANLNMLKISEEEEITLDDVLNLKNNDKEIEVAFKYEDSVILVVDQYECKVSKALQVEDVSEYNPSKLRKVEREFTFCEFGEKEI